MRKITITIGVSFVSLLLIAFATTMLTGRVLAAPVTITVNSTGDSGDLNAGNGICETSTPGECTLRAAVEEANSNGNSSDQDVIEFNITGGGVKTITLSGPLYVMQNVLINGYSQPGAAANTAAYPAALNGTLLIQLTGPNAKINTNSTGDNSVIRGLVINGNISIDPDCDGVKVQGNYIYTDPSGLIATWPENASHAIVTNGSNVTVGGVNPGDRNVIAARGSYFVSVAGVSNGGSIIKGNNFGVGSDSITPLPQDITYISSVGGLTVTGSNNVIGGTNAGEGNYISNTVFEIAGLYLNQATNTTVKGNQITDNVIGIRINQGSNNISIGGTTSGARNIISGNIGNTVGSGVIIDDTSSDVDIQGNYIGVDSDGVSVLPNSHTGITTSGTNISIGGTTSGARNIISGNGATGVNARGIDVRGINTVITGNYIGVADDGTTSVPNGGDGIVFESPGSGIVGGTVAGSPNIIANNTGTGVAVKSNVTSVLGNSIHDNGLLGIDLGVEGVNPNDVLDEDVGSNDLLNFPNLLVPVESGGNTEAAYRLDVPAGDYRVEFFSNATYDPSGHGEGGVYISSDTVTSLGVGAQLFSTTLSGDTYTNLSATITKIDSESPSGFGVTSEFSGQPFTDGNIAITKSVVDQNTIITDGTIQYTVNVTNIGQDSIDLTRFTVDSGDPLNTALFNDIFPDNLTLDSVTGDADCAEQNPSSDFGTLFSAHTNNIVASCSYTGVSTVLNPGATLGFTLTFSLTNTSQNIFSNNVINVPSLDDIDYAIYEAAVSSGNDIINELGSSIDNLATATTTAPEADIAVTKSILDQQTIATNGTIQYNVNVTNNGQDPIDLTRFTVDSGDPLNTALFNDIFPDNLTLDSVTGDADCAEQNPSSDFGTLFSAHTNNIVASCSYTGVSTVLNPGATLGFTLTFSLTNPAFSTFSNSLLSVPRATDSGYAIYEAAVSSGNDIINELGSSIDNLATATTTAPEADIAVTKQLLTDPGNVIAGGNLSYSLTYTNHGNDAVYLGDNAIPLGSNPIFYDYTHPDLTVSAGSVVATDTPFPGVNLIDVGNPDLSCLEAGPGSAGGFLSFVKYADYGFIACWYTGSDSSLASGASMTANLNFDVANDSDLDFANYAFATPDIGGSSDPDIQNIFESANGAEDQLDGLIKFTNTNAINNFASSRLPIDVHVSSQILAPPASISEGTPIKLQVTLQNNGPATFVFSQYANSQNSLLNIVFPFDDVLFEGVEDNLIPCADTTVAAPDFLGIAAQDHPNYHLVLCTGSDSNIVVPVGESRSLTLLFRAKSTVTSSFNFYSINASAESDPDIFPLFGTIFGATEDVLDTIDNANFSSARYSGTLVSITNGNTAGDEQVSSSSSLVGTGEDRKRILVIASVLLAAGLVFTVVIMIRKKQSISK